MERNNKHARNVWKCENLPSLDLLLTSIANTTDQRLPAPVYHTLGMVLERFVKNASTVTEIDMIQEIASKWRKLGQIRELVRQRDRALTRCIERYKETYGYRLRSGTRHEIITSAAKALRKVESGEWVFATARPTKSSRSPSALSAPVPATSPRTKRSPVFEGTPLLP